MQNDNQFGWLSKLIGFDYEICYKRGNENVVADVLSRIQGHELLAIALSVGQGTLLTEIEDSWRDPQLSLAIERLKSGQKGQFTWKQGMLLKNEKLVVRKVEELRQKILSVFHASATSGHSGIHATTKRITSYCYWKG